MKYFKYQYQDSMGDIWGLFSGLSESVESINNRGLYGHTIEIINSAMNGNLSSNSEDEFDLKAYEMRCKKTDDIELDKTREKYLSIVDTVNGDDNDSVGYGEISSNKLSSLEDAFGEFEKRDEFDTTLLKLFNMRSTYLINEGVDIIDTLINSLDGIPEAVDEMQELIINDSFLRDIVSILCENGNNILRSALEDIR